MDTTADVADGIQASPGTPTETPAAAAPATTGTSAADPTAAGIVIDAVSYAYRAGRTQVPAVHEVSLDLPPGALGVLVGPSGCGKSTLLRLVADLARPDRGTISFAGRPVEELRRQRQVGFAFQDPGLLSWRTVRRNIELPFDLSGIPRDREWVDHLLAITHLTDWAKHRPARLSGGMRQRVALARALATRPDVLLLDEPFGALDEITRAELNIELLDIVTATGTTCLLVTHSVEEAVLLGDRIVVLGPRPCAVRSTHDVAIPRAQRREARDTPAFAAICRAVRQSLEAR